jgi:DNA polymerase-3 subunit delta'
MAHHAYVYAGDRAAGLAASRVFAESALGLSGTDNPNIAVFEFGLFSVDDARRVGSFASQSQATGDRKLIVIATGRLFHEAQNALLKLFEEPTEGTTLVLVVPSEGILLPTLRSRLITLPEDGARSHLAQGATEEFLKATKPEREKYVTKLIARSKSDKDAEKQAARLEAASLVDGITRAAYAARSKATGEKGKELDLLLRDLDRFAPIMHERSAPLKLIFEHLLLVLPEGLGK